MAHLRATPAAAQRRMLQLLEWRVGRTGRGQVQGPMQEMVQGQLALLVVVVQLVGCIHGLRSEWGWMDWGWTLRQSAAADSACCNYQVGAVLSWLPKQSAPHTFGF